jgi:gamma-glutamylputrescine oxidase
MAWQSPIAPGISWYQTTVDDRPEYPSLDGSKQVEVAVIGGGFTGLQAAYNLAKSGISVVLIEAHHFGDGASGRNGGQFGTGQRSYPDEMEPKIGYEHAKALFDIAEDAKAYVMDFAKSNAIDMSYQAGQMNVSHKQAYANDYRRSADTMAEKYNYPHLTYMEKAETQERVGSSFYLGGVRDSGTGHINPATIASGIGKSRKTSWRGDL